IMVGEGGGVTTDHDAFVFDRASFLLGNDDRAVFTFGTSNTWHPEYDWDLGLPVGDYYAVGASVYRRDFTAGTVVVNAGNTNAATIDLGRSFLDENANAISSVTLGATRGAILRGTSNSGSIPPATTATPSTTTPPPTAPAPTSGGSCGSSSHRPRSWIAGSNGGAAT